MFWPAALPACCADHSIVRSLMSLPAPAAGLQLFEVQRQKFVEKMEG